MNIVTVGAIAAIKRMNHSQLARAAGVSRQRVSQWFAEADVDGFINIQTKHLLSIASALKVSADDLLQPLPLSLSDSRTEQKRLSYSSRLLWDKLYPDLVSLFAGALNGQKDAIARVVQVLGLYDASKLLGQIVWRDYPRYKVYIKPIRRRELEHLWQHRQNQMTP